MFQGQVYMGSEPSCSERSFFGFGTGLAFAFLPALIFFGIFKHRKGYREYELLYHAGGKASIYGGAIATMCGLEEGIRCRYEQYKSKKVNSN